MVPPAPTVGMRYGSGRNEFLNVRALKGKRDVTVTLEADVTGTGVWIPAATCRVGC